MLLKNTFMQLLIVKLNTLEDRLDKLETKEVPFVQSDEKNLAKKKNILERLKELEKINEEKESQIILLTNKLENWRQK